MNSNLRAQEMLSALRYSHDRVGAREAQAVYAKMSDADLAELMRATVNDLGLDAAAMSEDELLSAIEAALAAEYATRSPEDLTPREAGILANSGG